MDNLTDQVLRSDLTHFSNEASEDMTGYLTVLDEMPEDETKEFIKVQALNIKNNIQMLKTMTE